VGRHTACSFHASVINFKQCDQYVRASPYNADGNAVDVTDVFGSQIEAGSCGAIKAALGISGLDKLDLARGAVVAVQCDEGLTLKVRAT